MNIYVMVDMEGISGITDRSQTSYGAENYREGRIYSTWDVNACVEGCIQGGAERVIVVDHHGMGKNLIWEELSPYAEIIVGDLRAQRVPGIEYCNGVILLGYHSMAGTYGGILGHTWAYRWQNMWINGQLAGEILLDAAIAGEYGKPVIMISGDDKACAEAEKIIPGIVTAKVKTGISANGGILLAKTRAHELITQKAKEAVKKCNEIKPFKVEPPVTIRLELTQSEKIPLDIKPYMKRIDGRTYEITADSVEKALFRLF